MLWLCAHAHTHTLRAAHHIHTDREGVASKTVNARYAWVPGPPIRLKESQPKVLPIKKYPQQEGMHHFSEGRFKTFSFAKLQATPTQEDMSTGRFVFTLDAPQAQFFARANGSALENGAKMPFCTDSHFLKAKTEPEAGDSHVGGKAAGGGMCAPAA